MLRLSVVLLLLVVAACGGSDPSVDESALSADASGALALPAALAESDPSTVSASDGVVSSTRPATSVRSVNDWVVSTAPRALDGLDDVVAYRPADDVTGANLEDVLLYVRCRGDRTEAELQWGVRLGDDVYEDDDVTKRVLFRFVPDFQEAVVWPVSNTGGALVVLDPIDFLRRFVSSYEVLVQTTSWNGTVLFAQFVITPAALDRLSVLATSCRWILDSQALAVSDRRDAATLFAIERQRVLNTYLGSPLRDDLGQFRVDEAGDIYMDLPAPVGRAFLGFGVSTTDVGRARSLGRGVLCLAGSWVIDEIILRECYLEDSFDQDVLDGITELSFVNPPPP